VDGDKIHPSKETADKQEPIGYIIKHGIWDVRSTLFKLYIIRTVHFRHGLTNTN
jgi:hypothetical protein